LLDQQLELDAALFHIVKRNARETLADGSTQLSGKQRVQGLELGLTGHLSEYWTVFANYIFLDSKTLKATPGGNSFASKGHALHNTMVGFQANRQLDLQLNVNNLFDKAYVERVRQQNGSDARSSAIEYGASRAAIVTANYPF